MTGHAYNRRCKATASTLWERRVQPAHRCAWSAACRAATSAGIGWSCVAEMGSLDLPTEPRAFDPPRRHFMGTCSDISERVAAAQLRHALLERSTAAIVVTTPQRIILQANHRAQEIFAPPATSLVGQHARILHFDEAYACAIEAHYQQLRDEGQTRAGVSPGGCNRGHALV